MKYVFLILLACLIAASVATMMRQPEMAGNGPVIRWATDPNPAREEQVRLFHRWMKKSGYPDFQVLLDTDNADKRVIQGVSGVGDDVMDMLGGTEMQYFQATGIITDLTKDAQEMGFDPSHTYAALESEITLEDADDNRRQYAFPCNVAVTLYYVNKETFRRYGQALPPVRWNLAEFEQIGRRFVAAANSPGARQTVFFADRIPFEQLRRSFGLSEFNETMTRCILNDPRNVSALKTLWRWTYVDHLVPTAADMASFSTDSGYMGEFPQLFNTGNYALLWTGRYMLIQFRQFNKDRLAMGRPPMDLSAAEPPYAEIPNTAITTRAAVLYTGSKHPELAKYLLAFLASDKYNREIVQDADSLPPNPKYTQEMEYTDPPDHHDEGETNRLFVKAAKEIAVGNAYSPFVLYDTFQREDDAACEKYLNGLISAEQAGKLVQDRINQDIDDTLRENPGLRPWYDKLMARQELIEQYRASGKRVPINWIANPFLRKYYRFKGWAE